MKTNLKRKIDKQLENWKNTRNQALLVTGARQIGKTFSISDFVEKNFENVISINFAFRTDLISLFAELKNSQQLLTRVSSLYGEKMIAGKTVIFFDEIQLLYKRREDLRKRGTLDLDSQDIITAMKAAVIDGRYRFILSGSLLGVETSNVVLNPTGYMDVFHMYPLDFEEYLWAKGVGEDAISEIKGHFLERTIVDPPINKLFLDYFREYVLIGGMPEAVLSFLKEGNLYLVQSVQEQIKTLYQKDITQYVEESERIIKIKEIYDAIPSELNSKNKRFVSSHVADKNYLSRKGLEDEFLWLTNADVAIPVYNVTDLEAPLTLASQRKTLKLFMNDIGLLGASILGMDMRRKLLSNEKEINFGAPYENVVAQELSAHGFKEKLYYYNSKKHGEIDFVIEYNGDVLPLEIKSGKPNQMNVYNHCALSNALKLYEINEAMVFGETNVKRETDNVVQFPIYMISFLSK